MAIQDDRDLTEAQRRFIMLLPPSNPISTMMVFSHIVGLTTIWALYRLFMNTEAGDYVKNLAAFGVPLVVFIQFLSCCFLVVMTAFVHDADHQKEARMLAAGFRGEWKVRVAEVVGMVEDLVIVALAVMLGHFWWPIAMLSLMGVARVLLFFIRVGVYRAVKEYDPDAIVERNGHVPEDGITTGNIWRSN